MQSEGDNSDSNSDSGSDSNSNSDSNRDRDRDSDSDRDGDILFEHPGHFSKPSFVCRYADCKAKMLGVIRPVLAGHAGGGLGMLLTGQSGAGKTSVAQAVASEFWYEMGAWVEVFNCRELHGKKPDEVTKRYTACSAADSCRDSLRPCPKTPVPEHPCACARILKSCCMLYVCIWLLAVLWM